MASNIIISGAAGSGKSHLVRQWPPGMSTASAFSPIHDSPRAMTIHALTGVKPSAITNALVLFQMCTKQDSPLWHVCKFDEVLYVEEAFTCPAFMIALLIALVDHYARVHGRAPLRIVLIGDPFQCPPVLHNPNNIRCASGLFVGDPFILAHLQAKHIHLTTSHRHGQCERTQTLMRACRHCVWSPTALDVLRNYVYTGPVVELLKRMVVLVATNDKVAKITEQHMTLFAKKTKIIAAPAPNATDCEDDSIQIAIGQTCVCTRNHSPPRGPSYYNGEVVTVLAINGVSDEEGGPLPITMRAKGCKFITLQRESGDIFDMVPSKTSSGGCQFDLLSGTILTIHRAQGMTLARVAIDLENVETPGSVYTAMSRIREVGDPSDLGTHTLGEKQNFAVLNLNEDHLVDQRRHLNPVATEFDERGVKDTPMPHKLHEPRENCIICMCAMHSLKLLQ